MRLNPIDQSIWTRFKVRKNDNLPYRGFAGTRVTLFELMRDLNFKVGVEIGTDRGINAEMIFQTISGVTLICVDPWLAYRGRTQQEMDNGYEISKRKLEPFGATILRKTSLEVVKDFSNRSLDFVYIDGNHEFNYFMPDLIFWADKVKIGGIVAGHDYYTFYRSGVVAAVDAYTRCNNISPWYITREQEPTFFWVNK